MEQRGERFKGHARLTLAEEVVQTAQSHIEILSRTWMAQLKLIKRTEAVIQERRAKAADGKNALVLNGDIGDPHVALHECTEFDLWDRICQSSVFYPGVDARLPAIRRAPLFDAMLGREGHRAVCATLTDEQLVEVGNAAARFLRTRLGDACANGLVSGRETLPALGIEKDLEDVLSRSLGTPTTIDARRAAEKVGAPGPRDRFAATA